MKALAAGFRRSQSDDRTRPPCRPTARRCHDRRHCGWQRALSFFSQPYEVSIQTTYWGARPELVELLHLASRGLVHVESTAYRLDDAPQAYRDLREGKVRGRAVVVPN